MSQDCVCVPGMSDVSPEELRYEAYGARAANTMDQHVNKIKELVEDFTGKRNILKNPNQNLKQVYLNLLNYFYEFHKGSIHLTPIDSPWTIIFFFLDSS